MAVYSKSGTQLNAVYNRGGDSLASAYDVDGNKIFDSGSPPTPPTPSADSLTIMTYNVQTFTVLNADNAMQNSFVALYNPDVIAFQEFVASFASVQNDYYYKYGYKYCDGVLSGNGVSSKYPITSYETVYFQEAGSLVTDAVDPKFFHVVVNVNGKSVHVISIHLALLQTTRASQAAELFDFVADLEYFVLLGDFNTVGKNTSSDDYLTVIKPFVDEGYNLVNCTTGTGFVLTWGNSTSPTSLSDLLDPTDNIITSTNISIDNVTFDQTKLVWSREQGKSIDHIPVIAELTIN